MNDDNDEEQRCVDYNAMMLWDDENRLSGEMASVQSLLPLHSAIATSRMVTQLSTKAGTMLQNTLTHMSPDR